MGRGVRGLEIFVLRGLENIFLCQRTRKMKIRAEPIGRLRLSYICVCVCVCVCLCVCVCVARVSCLRETKTFHYKISPSQSIFALGVSLDESLSRDFFLFP